jgi:hypothetical protein
MNKSISFYISIIVLIIWVVYSWIKGPTQTTIDAKFTTIENINAKILYIVKFYSGGLLLSGNTPYEKGLKSVKLEDILFSMDGERDQEVKKSIVSYYAPYMTSITDTFDVYSLATQQAVVDQMQLKMPQDTIFDGKKYKVEKDIWPSKKIVLSYNDTSYLALSLSQFQDINKRYQGAAPQDFDRFMEVSKRVHKLYKGKLKAKILSADTVKKLPYIYEITDETGNTVSKDHEAFDRLKTTLYEDTEFMIWYKRDGFLTSTFFILLFMTFAFFKKR